MSETTFAPSAPDLPRDGDEADPVPHALDGDSAADHDLDDTGAENNQHIDREDGAATGTKQSAPAKRGLDRGAIRRIAVKAQEVTETEETITGLAAHLLGCGTGLADLTTAIMSAPRSATAPISDLTTIAEADPMEAGVIAAEMGRDRIKAVWNLLAALGAGSSGAMPSANVKAAIAVAKAVFALDEDKKADLESVRALLRKN
ncbi:hypothetical protein [Nocardioides pakistanensis]